MRAMGNAIRYVWRSRVAWVVLTAVVVGDTWYWQRDWEEGLVPQIVFGRLGAPPRKMVTFPSIEILVRQPDPGGVYEYAFEATHLNRQTPPDWLYLVRVTELTEFDGLWALCVRHQHTRMITVDLRKGSMFASSPPKSVAMRALDWYETLPMENGWERQWRARLIECVRAGDVKRTILWGGVLHDSVMSLLTLLWLVLTFAHGRRLVLSATVERRRRRRREAGLCERCGYPLIGQHFSRCPECGAELENA